MGDRWGTNTNIADERLSFTLSKSKSMSLKQANAKVKVKARARSDKQILQQMTSQLMSVPSFPPRSQTNQKPKKRPSSEEKQKEKQHQQPQQHPIRNPRTRTRALTPPPPPLSIASISSSKASNCSSESIGASSSRNCKSYNTSIRRGSNGSCSSSCSISDASNERQQHRAAASAATTQHTSTQAAGLRRWHRRRKRTIHWNKNVRVKVIQNVESYTRQEKKDTWYSADEYSLMEDECELTSTCMDKMCMDPQQLELNIESETKATNALPAGFSERGLESWTIRGEELKETRVQLVIETVWQSQIDAWALFDGAKLYSLKSYNSTIDDDDENEDDNNDKIHKDCWEYIRRESVKVSSFSSMIAQELASKDEEAVLLYLKTVRSLEQSRKRIACIASMFLGEQRDRATTSTINNEREGGEDSIVRTSSADNNYNNSSCDSIGANNKKSILKRPKLTPSNCESSRSLRKSCSCSPLPPAKAKGKIFSLSPPRNRIERPTIFQCQRERQQRPNSSSSTGQIGSDVNPRRPERFVSPTTPSTFLTGITLDDDVLPPMALTPGGAEDNADGIDAAPKILTLGNNDYSAHKSNDNDDDNSIGTKKKKIRFQSKGKTKIIPGNSNNNNNTSGGINTNDDDTDSSISDDDSLSIQGPGCVFDNNKKKKIQFIPKSKTKIPTSPVGSVCNSLRSNNASGTCSISNYNDIIGDEDSLNMQRRRMQSHMTMSVASEESSSIRRRIRRTAAVKIDQS